MITKLAYGKIEDGRLVHVSHVKSGLRCGCNCPACGSPLVAKKGAVVVHHFAHGTTVECEGAAETALHLAAKQLIIDRGAFVIPGLYYYPRGHYVDAAAVELAAPRNVAFTDIREEVAIGNRVIDVVASVGGRRLLVEIAVTHFVDQEKADQMADAGASCMEIDLSHLRDGFTEAELEEAVVEGVDRKTWICNARWRALVDRWERDEAERGEARKRMEAARAAAFKSAKYQARRSGFDILEFDDAADVVCPGQQRKNRALVTTGVLSVPLAKGGYWNGRTYRDRMGVGRIYIDGKKHVIWPEYVDPNGVFVPHVNVGRLYHQLAELRRVSLVVRQKCEGCRYRGEELDERGFEFSCTYRRVHMTSLSS